MAKAGVKCRDFQRGFSPDISYIEGAKEALSVGNFNPQRPRRVGAKEAELLL